MGTISTSLSDFVIMHAASLQLLWPCTYSTVIYIKIDSGAISSALQMTAFQAFMVSIVRALMKQRALCQPLKLSRRQHKLQLNLPRNQ